MNKRKNSDSIVKYETAVLAQKYGYKGVVSTLFGHHYYNYLGELDGDCLKELKHRKETPNPYISIPAPKQSVLQKWLREERNISIDVITNVENGQFKYNIQIQTLDSKYTLTNVFKHYDDALEYGLQYVLNQQL